MDEACEKRGSFTDNLNKKPIYIENQEKRQMKLLEWKDGLENLKFTGHIEGKRSKGKKRVTYQIYHPYVSIDLEQ